MENNKMTELELKIEAWLEDEQFVKFAEARMNHEIKNVPHNYCVAHFFLLLCYYISDVR